MPKPHVETSRTVTGHHTSESTPDPSSDPSPDHLSGDSGRHPRVWIFAGVILLTVFLLALAGVTAESDKPAAGDQQAGPAPPPEYIQPVEFSHKKHADTNQIPCEFCHIYARRSINSGAPPMAGCYGCHSVVKGSEEKIQKAIQTLLEYQTSGKPVPWKKVHDVPDFVYFSHKRHVLAGFDCVDCHGEIYQHDVLSPQTMINDLSMGWCLQCHKEGRPALNGKVAGPMRETRGAQAVATGPQPQANGMITGGTDCNICHK